MRKLFFLLLILPFFSCRVLNPSVMFQTEKGYQFANDSIGSLAPEYLIAPGDHIEMRILTNDGFRLVDVAQGSVGIVQATFFLVEPDGLIKLPLLGKVHVKGLTVREAEKILEEKYALYFVTPFVTLRVTNRQVLVFQGNGGTGTVINLPNDNTSLIEALTLAGGVQERGRAYNIKLIRGDLKSPQIFQVDLSSIEGIKKSNLIVQAKDIIYVEPSPDYATKILVQITPYLALLTTTLLIVSLLGK